MNNISPVSKIKCNTNNMNVKLLYNKILLILLLTFIPIGISSGGIFSSFTDIFKKKASLHRVENLRLRKVGKELSLSEHSIISPIPTPTSLRDAYSFRQHVETSRKNRGLKMIEEFDDFPVYYYSNHNSFYETCLCDI